MASPLPCYEVANALRSHRIVELTAHEIFDAVRAIRMSRTVCGLKEDEWLLACELSIEEDVSIYDSIYLALAIRRNGVMITSDQRLYDRLSGGRKEHVRLL